MLYVPLSSHKIRVKGMERNTRDYVFYIPFTTQLRNMSTGNDIVKENLFQWGL